MAAEPHDPVDGEFYVGYMPEAPPRLARRTRGLVLALAAFVLAFGALLVSGQAGFGYGVFEYGTEREFEGVIEAAPYPVLAIARPGGGASRYLLSSFGKHGAMPLVSDVVGRRVQLRGTLAYRDGLTMIEVVEGSVKPVEGLTLPVEPAARDLGEVTLIGEIVDSKCYLGVMKPGNTKAHRDCAVRCISGGIPPVLLVRDSAGNASYYLLVGENGESLNDAVLDLVAEPIEIRGQLRRYGDLQSLHAAPATFRRL